MVCIFTSNLYLSAFQPSVFAFVLRENIFARDSLVPNVCVKKSKMSSGSAVNCEKFGAALWKNVDDF
jgi:hypothetical protein